MKLLIAIQHIFVEIKLKTENLKFFWVPEFCDQTSTLHDFYM